MIMDFHISCFYGLLILLPYPVSCSTAPWSDGTTYYYSGVNYNFCHLTISATGLSIIVSLLYRYCSLKNEERFFYTKKAVFFIAASIIIYPMPAFMPNLLAFRDAQSYIKDCMSDKYPEFYYVYTNISCSTFCDATLSMLGVVGTLVM
ncbi:hypothetical protein FO519_009962, partial [Halicephalobus sp. NKZ332]